MTKIDTSDVEILLKYSYRAATAGGLQTDSRDEGDPELAFAALGALWESHRSVDGDISSPKLLPDSLDPRLVAFGQKYFARMQSALHDLICGDDDENREDRSKIWKAITPEDIATTIATLIATALGIQAVLAAALSVLIVRLFWKPLGKTICEVWAVSVAA